MAELQCGQGWLRAARSKPISLAEASSTRRDRAPALRKLMPNRRTPTQLRKQIVTHLDDFPRQLEALEASMATFGEGFELSEFKKAFNRQSGPDSYVRVQAVERGFSRVQNY